MTYKSSWSTTSNEWGFSVSFYTIIQNKIETNVAMCGAKASNRVRALEKSHKGKDGKEP
jgi:hypothetical protein